MIPKPVKRFPVKVVLQALVKYHAGRVEADPDFKQSYLADEMKADESNLSRWLSGKAKPRGNNFNNCVSFLQSVGALPAA